jgi:hypothetical protein
MLHHAGHFEECRTSYAFAQQIDIAGISGIIGRAAEKHKSAGAVTLCDFDAFVNLLIRHHTRVPFICQNGVALDCCCFFSVDLPHDLLTKIIELLPTALKKGANTLADLVRHHP